MSDFESPPSTAEAAYEVARDILSGLIAHASVNFEDPEWARRLPELIQRRETLRPSDIAAVQNVLDENGDELAVLGAR